MKFSSISKMSMTITLFALFLTACTKQITKETARILRGKAQLWYTSEAAVSWQQKPGPGKGLIESLTEDPHEQGRIMLCRNGTLWISFNKGQTWKSPLFDVPEEQGVYAAFDPKEPKRLLLATNKRLLVSNNEGEEWIPVTPGLEFKWRPHSIQTCTSEPDRMYLLTRGEGVYSSNDGGRTWAVSNSGLPKGIGASPLAPIESVAVDPRDANVIYVVVEAKGIFRTADGGRSWVSANNGLPAPMTHRTPSWVLAIDISNPQRLLLWASWPVNADFVDSAFFLTKDRAESWRKISAGPAEGRVFTIQFVDSATTMAVASTEDKVIHLPR